MEHLFNFTSQFDLVGSTFDQLALTAIFILAWTLIFLLVNNLVRLPNMPLKQSNDTKNRIVSIIHGLITFAMSVWVIFATGESFDVEYILPLLRSPNTQAKNLTVIVSLSYIIYDLVACYHYGLFDAGLIIHHVLCIVGYVSGLADGYGSIISVGGIYYAEASNLPMHLRMIAKNAGLRYSNSYEFFENLYLGTSVTNTAIYIPSRGIFCLLNLLYPSLMSVKAPWGVRLVCLAIMLQSGWYITTMFGMIKKKQREYREMRQKNISYNWFSIAPDLARLSFYKKEDKRKIF